MTGLFQRGQVIEGALLFGWVALNRVDYNRGVQVKQHSRPSRRCATARRVLLTVTLGVLGQAGVVVGMHLFHRPSREAA
jgi:hypothetical protein